MKAALKSVCIFRSSEIMFSLFLSLKQNPWKGLWIYYLDSQNILPHCLNCPLVVSIACITCHMHGPKENNGSLRKHRVLLETEIILWACGQCMTKTGTGYLLQLDKQEKCEYNLLIFKFCSGFIWQICCFFLL